MAMYVVEMPDDWGPGFACEKALVCDGDCDACHLANAKKAVEVRQDLAGFGYGNGTDIFNEHGKPVKLYAVEEGEGK